MEGLGRGPRGSGGLLGRSWDVLDRILVNLKTLSKTKQHRHFLMRPGRVLGGGGGLGAFGERFGASWGRLVGLWWRLEGLLGHLGGFLGRVVSESSGGGLEGVLVKS